MQPPRVVLFRAGSDIMSFVMSQKDCISRRRFLKYGAAAGAALYGISYLGSRQWPRQLKGLKPNELRKALVVARGNDPAALTRKAIETLGGMEKLVSRGDVVVVKPNMAFNSAPEYGATTNPQVVGEVVRMCLEAGARTVKVFDHTPSDNPAPAYEASGIAEEAAAAGAQVRFVRPEGFRALPIEEGKALAAWPFYEEAVFADECDVLINVPVAKHHSTSRLSMGLKNVFGMVGGTRGTLHQDIHTKIADLNRVVRTDLTVLDAFRVLRRHGPSGGRLEDVDNSREGARRVVACVDRVAVDAYGATMFGLKPQELGFVAECHAAGLGEMDLSRVPLVEVTV